MATKTAKRPSGRERLLAASDELFYRDGVHSTGIDAIIERAGVAKPRSAADTAESLLGRRLVDR